MWCMLREGCPQSPEEDIKSPGTEVGGGCEPPDGVLGTKLRSSVRAGSAFKNSFSPSSVFTFADVAMEASLIVRLLLANLL